MTKSKSKKSSKGIIIVAGVIVILIVAIILLFSIGGSEYPSSELDKFAQCLTEKGVVEYGAFWCPNCAKQKKMFGSSYKYINYIECDARGENEQSELCIEKKVEKYPDWEFADGSRLVGLSSFEELSEKSGCPPPQKS